MFSLKKERVYIRNPYATRPWQHVLEPLAGYLLLGQKLLEGNKEFADGWNFGPGQRSNITVEKVVDEIKHYWNELNIKLNQDAEHPHEANLLMLDCSKAHSKLNWWPKLNNTVTFKLTSEWYKAFYTQNKLLSKSQLREFIFEMNKS